jgi:hypothetical protein
VVTYLVSEGEGHRKEPGAMFQRSECEEGIALSVHLHLPSRFPSGRKSDNIAS